MTGLSLQHKQACCTVEWLLAPWINISVANVINGMTLDSRAIQVGDLFVALKGAVSDGRSFIDSAIVAGATAVLSETTDITLNGQVSFKYDKPIIQVYALNQHLSAIAMRYYFPDSNLHSVTAITGTNGKTTIATLLANSYMLLGKQSAQMGTNGNGLFGQLETSLNTTLDAISVCRSLKNYQEQNVTNTVMEVSSHGLLQSRVAAIPFTTGIFTNLTRDHLDYHGSMAAYADAKKMLFGNFPLKHRIINADDDTGKRWLTEFPDAIAYGFTANEQSTEQQFFKIKLVEYLAKGIQFEFTSSWGEGVIEAGFYGDFNVLNIAALCCALLTDGFSIQNIKTTISKLAVVPGRMEQYFFVKQNITFVVDYAHTPDALESALKALQCHKQKGRIIAVFGCGGDRDKGKRPQMAKVAEQCAEMVVIVDDNPRSENAAQIVEDIKKGLINPEKALVIHNRQQAISHLLQTAAENDIILLAGKGHEDYQIFGNEKVHYSDRECLSELIANNELYIQHNSNGTRNNKNQETT